MEFVELFSENEALRAIVLTTSVLALTDLVLGVCAAIVAKVFDPNYITNFIRKHVVGRVFPIITVAVLGVIEPTLFAIAAAAAAAYAVETLASIRDSFKLPGEVKAANAKFDELLSSLSTEEVEARFD